MPRAVSFEWTDENGVTTIYPSKKAAADALGLSHGTIIRYAKDGIHDASELLTNGNPQPFEWTNEDGVTTVYPSRTAAAEALGLSYRSIRYYVKQGIHNANDVASRKPKPCRWNGNSYETVKAMSESESLNEYTAGRYLNAGYKGHGDIPSNQNWYTLEGDKRVYSSQKQIASAYNVKKQSIDYWLKKGKVSLYVDCFRAPTKADYAMLNEWLESGDKALENEAQCVLLRADGLSLWDIAVTLDIDEIEAYEYLKRWNDGN